MSPDVWAALISTLVGAFAGFGLSELAAYFRHRRSENEQSNNIRILLSVELEQNNHVLQSFHAHMHNLKMFYPRDFNHIYQVLKEHAPVWGYKMWESQLAVLPIGLRPEEVKNLSDFYRDLGRLSSYVTEVIKIYEAMRTSNDGSFWIFDKDGMMHNFEKCAALVNEIIERESPIHPQISLE